MLCWEFCCGQQFTHTARCSTLSSLGVKTFKQMWRHQTAGLKHIRHGRTARDAKSVPIWKTSCAGLNESVCLLLFHWAFEHVSWFCCSEFSSWMFYSLLIGSVALLCLPEKTPHFCGFHSRREETHLLSSVFRESQTVAE